MSKTSWEEKIIKTSLNLFLITFKKIQKQPPEVFYLKKTFLEIFAIFTGIHLCWTSSEYCKIFKSTYFEEHLRTAASKNVLMKQKIQLLFI